MDANKIKSAVLSTINDAISVSEYGHGHLVTFPLAFYDNDLVTLFVEPYEGGVRVSDQGTTAMRLHMANVDLDNRKIAESWRRSVASLGARSMTSEDGVVAAWGKRDDLGNLLIRVAEATMRVDQLRWAVNERRPVKFKDRVVHKLTEVLGGTDQVTPNAHLRQKSGRMRQVTASIGSDPDRAVYVQAVSASSGDSAKEHCYFIFSQTDIKRERKIAVASGTADDWPHLADEMENVAEIAFFDGQDLASKVKALAMSAL